ncbi:MAG TPA: TolC family protein [Bacteroidales bacterium]|nr:TolC family protein [Bacteroidales bacterium]
MKMISLLLISILATAGTGVFAQDQPGSLTLEQAIEYALQHNKTVLNARGQVASSIEQVKAARAQGLPQIDGSLDFMTYFNYEMNFSFGGGSTGGSLGDVMPMPPFDVGDTLLMHMISESMSGGPIVMNNQMSGKVQFSQLIWSGQYWSGVAIAKIAKDLSSQNVVKTEQDVKEGVKNTYYMILVTQKNLDIIQENIKNLNETLKHTENMFRTGIAEPTDVDQIRITLSQLVNSQKSVERAVQMGYNMLKFQLGVAPDANISLADNIDGIMTLVDPAKTLDPTFDVTNNIDYSMMESQVKISEKQLGMQNWSYSPTVAGFYSYTKKIITTGFDMTPNHLAGFSVTVPIFSSGLRRAQVNQAKVNLDMARRNQEMVKEQLETQKNQLLFNYQSAYENYNTQKENVDIARRVYQNIQNKYNQGMVSSLDLTQANMNLLGAESNYFSAILTLLQAQTSLDKLFNKI